MYVVNWAEWMPRWVRSRQPEPEVRRAPEPTQPARRRMSAEYLALHTYLENRYAATVVLTLEQIEALLGFPLPSIARSDASWWTAATSMTDVRYQDAWKLAGRSAVPNLPARTVIFERAS